MRDALVALVRGFRFEITLHVSTGATDDDEPRPQGDVYAVTERAPLGFTPES